MVHKFHKPKWIPATNISETMWIMKNNHNKRLKVFYKRVISTTFRDGEDSMSESRCYKFKSWLRNINIFIDIFLIFTRIILCIICTSLTHHFQYVICFTNNLIWNVYIVYRKTLGIGKHYSTINIYSFKFVWV